MTTSSMPLQLDMFVTQSLRAHIVDVASVANASPYKGPRNLLRKANAAIHVYSVKGRYSLAMRRLFNALLALSHAKLLTLPKDTLLTLTAEDKVLRFESTVSDLKELIGWSHSGDNQTLYEMMAALQALQVCWDYTDLERNERWRNEASLVSQCGRTADGKVAWLWVPDLFALLFDPSNNYTPLDLELSLQFRSKYTLAVFENVYRYRNMRLTPWRAVNEWRLLFAGPGVYGDYREFKRAVIMPSLKEIAETPICPVEFELREEKGPNNRVERLSFVIKMKPQAALDLDLPATRNPVLEQRLRRLGLKGDKLRELLVNHDEPYLLKQLDILERDIARRAKDITSPTGYFLWLVANNQPGADEAQEIDRRAQERLRQLAQEESAQNADARWRELRSTEATRWLNRLEPETRKKFEQAFYDQASDTLKRSLQRHGAESKMWKLAWMEWLCKQPNVLQSQLALDKVKFLELEVFQRESVE